MLRAKLQTPTIHKNIVSRGKLLQKLERGTESKLTLVIAPAGYGKTTAVLDWLRNCGLPSAWLSLDTHDNNPALFWRYFSKALEETAGGVMKSVEYVLAAPELLKAHHKNDFGALLSCQNSIRTKVSKSLYFIQLIMLKLTGMIYPGNGLDG